MTNDCNELPDFPYINKIAEKLWIDREFGQASVMIGSGFSLNANKKTPATPDFPLWYDLGIKMFDQLYSKKNYSEEEFKRKRDDKTIGMGVMKLASEYEAYFGRLELNKFLKQQIPDDTHEPSKLHKSILNLPWSDVFTTNYDTLLERTLQFVHNRKYDIITNKESIPGSMKPRIIKLHGSLPYLSELVFTEEDYRKYPRDSSTLVNMVQQSLMENIFCLIGFSSNDPNFLAWRGWVRDNLGNNTPSIYLVGLFDYSNPERKILENNYIKVIDLSPLFPKTNSRRHFEATEWFVKVLESYKPYNKMNWPIINYSYD